MVHFAPGDWNCPMSLKSLVLCSDEKIVRVLRRVLSDLEIGIEHCTDPTAPSASSPARDLKPSSSTAPT